MRKFLLQLLLLLLPAVIFFRLSPTPVYATVNGCQDGGCKAQGTCNCSNESQANCGLQSDSHCGGCAWNTGTNSCTSTGGFNCYINSYCDVQNPDCGGYQCYVQSLTSPSGDGCNGNCTAIAETCTVSSPGITTGILGKARSFSGYQYLSVADNTNLRIPTTGMSVSVWFKTNVTGTRKTLVLKDSISGTRNYWGIWITQYNLVDAFYVNGSNVYEQYNSGKVVTDNQWHFAALTISNSTLTLYVDTEAPLSMPVTLGGTPNGEMDIGAWPVNISNSMRDVLFNGTIDEVGIWNRALTSTEISYLYHSGLASSYSGGSFTYDPGGTLPSNLVSFWKMDETSGIVAADAVDSNAGTASSDSCPASIQWLFRLDNHINYGIIALKYDLAGNYISRDVFKNYEFFDDQSHWVYNDNGNPRAYTMNCGYKYDFGLYSVDANGFSWNNWNFDFRTGFIQPQNCAPPPAPTCTVSLSPTSETLAVNSTALITASVTTTNTTSSTVNWSVSPTSGVVSLNPTSDTNTSSSFNSSTTATAVGGGTATVNASVSVTGPGGSGSCSPPTPTTINVIAASYFQTFGGDVVSKGSISDGNLPSGKYLSGK